MIGVVADDTTGANDIGIMFTNNGYLTKVLTFEEKLPVEADADVIAIDTDSRLDSANVAYQKVFTATRFLKSVGCTIFIKKTCSVFRGNIGAEFDAMLDALEAEFMVISLAFPKNGRQTVHGIHTVHGTRLECSEFANDPVHPMRTSDLVAILQNQTKRKVGLIDLAVVRQGRAVLQTALIEAKKKINYCIVDGQTQADLNLLARSIDGFCVLGGSSALAEEMPKFWPAGKVGGIPPKMNFSDSNGVLVVAGSLMPQTTLQTTYLRTAGMSTIVIDTREIFDATLIRQRADEAVNKLSALILAGKDALLMADNHPDIVQETKQRGHALGIDEMTVSKMVSAVLAEITAQIVKKTDLKRLVVAGGDTSGTICRKLGIKGNFVLHEIETGLPSGLAIGREMLIVLKSGSFGKPEFLLKAINHLKAIS